MSKLITKARSGVTLVELLVVILIVTILSVSMLPLLQPFVTESQYAAEAIPVIGNIRTKIGVYQYEKGYLPNSWGMTGSDTLEVETWAQSQNGDSEVYAGASYDLTQITTERTSPTVANFSKFTQPSSTSAGNVAHHLSMQCDIDYQDLKGKRSKPLHYQYYVISATNNPSYVIACFGDGNGLKAGTGYAVCELNFTAAGKKYIGTWKRYKPQNDQAGSILFNSANAISSNTGKPIDCFVPSAADFAQTHLTQASQNGEPPLIDLMRQQGWEF